MATSVSTMSRKQPRLDALSHGPPQKRAGKKKPQGNGVGRKSHVSVRPRSFVSLRQHHERSRKLLHGAVVHLTTLKNLHEFGECKDLTAESALLKGMMRGMFGGDRVFHFYCSYALSFAAVGTTTVMAVNRAFTTDLQASGNWSALSSIFDEFIIDVMKYELVPSSAGFAVADPQPTYAAFDDDGASGVPASILELLDYPSCKIFCPAIQGATVTSESNSTGFYPITMTHHRLYVSDDAPVDSSNSTGWSDCALPDTQLGSIRLFNANVSATNNQPIYKYKASFSVRFRFMR